MDVDNDFESGYAHVLPHHPPIPFSFPLSVCDSVQPNTMVPIVYLFSSSISISSLLDKLSGNELAILFTSLISLFSNLPYYSLIDIFLPSLSQDAISIIPSVGGVLELKIKGEGEEKGKCGSSEEKWIVVDHRCGVRVRWERSSLSVFSYNPFEILDGVPDGHIFIFWMSHHEDLLGYLTFCFYQALISNGLTK